MIAEPLFLHGAVTPPMQMAGGQLPDSQGLSEVFLQLLLNELSNQDPLNPVEGAEFIAQLAQLRTVEQLQEMNLQLQEMNTGMRATFASQQLAQATALIGHTVQATALDGTTIEGQVTAASLRDGVVGLQVNGLSIPLNSVFAVSSTLEDKASDEAAGLPDETLERAPVEQL